MTTTEFRRCLEQDHEYWVDPKRGVRKVGDMIARTVYCFTCHRGRPIWEAGEYRKLARLVKGLGA